MKTVKLTEAGVRKVVKKVIQETLTEETPENLVGRLNMGSTYGPDEEEEAEGVQPIDSGIVEVGPPELEDEHVSIYDFAQAFDMTDVERDAMIADWFAEQKGGYALDLYLFKNRDGSFRWSIGRSF